VAACVESKSTTESFFQERRIQHWQQWVAFLVILTGLVLAVISNMHSQTPGQSIRQSKGGAQGVHIAGIRQGIWYMFFASFIEASARLLQEYQVHRYWKDSLSCAAACSISALSTSLIVMTTMGSSEAHYPDGAYRPQNDFQDIFVMCKGSGRLGFVMFCYIVCGAFAETAHLYLLHYMSAISRCMVEAWRMPTMWCVGKLCSYAPLADPWGPYSWLMLPAFLIIAWGMMMYKTERCCPLALLFEKATDQKEDEENNRKSQNFVSANLNNYLFEGTLGQRYWSYLQQAHDECLSVRKLLRNIRDAARQ
jgi:hypothetical protein